MLSSPLCGGIFNGVLWKIQSNVSYLDPKKCKWFWQFLYLIQYSFMSIDCECSCFFCWQLFAILNCLWTCSSPEWEYFTMYSIEGLSNVWPSSVSRMFSPQLTHISPPFRLLHQFHWYKVYILGTSYIEISWSDYWLVTYCKDYLDSSLFSTYTPPPPLQERFSSSYIFQ